MRPQTEHLAKPFLRGSISAMRDSCSVESVSKKAFLKTKDPIYVLKILFKIV